MLKSVVNNQFFKTFGGEDLCPTIFDKAMQLAFGLVKNYGFVDRSKRLATHAMLIYLSVNDYNIDFSQKEIYQYFYYKR